MQQITALSPTHYAETFAYTIDPPGDGIDGCHTLAMTEELTVIDCKKRKRAP